MDFRRLFPEIHGSPVFSLVLPVLLALRTVRRPKSPALSSSASIPTPGGNTSAGWARLGLCALALIAYANSFGLGLTTDARTIIASDVRIRSASVANLSQIL